MSEERGFGTERSPEGQYHARLLAEHLHAPRQLPTTSCAGRAKGPPRSSRSSGCRALASARRTKITRHRSDGPDGERLRILISVDDDSRRQRLNPLAEELIIATPDGEFTRESTLPNQTDDPRRFTGITPVMLAAGALLAVVLIVVFVLLS